MEPRTNNNEDNVPEDALSGNKRKQATLARVRTGKKKILEGLRLFCPPTKIQLEQFQLNMKTNEKKKWGRSLKRLLDAKPKLIE